MFTHRKKMLMAATAIVVGLTFNTAAQAHDPNQALPGAPVLETLKGIEAAILALDINQHFCENNEKTSAALEEKLDALMAEASEAYSQHAAMKATLKKIVTEGYGGDSGQFEDSAYLKAFEDKYLDILQIHDEILMVMPDDMTGPCSSPDQHAGAGVSDGPGDPFTDEYSEDAEVVSEFEEDVSFLLDAFVLEANYTEVRVPDLPAQFCSEEERDSFSRTIFHFEKQVTGNIREAMRLYDRAVEVKYENLESISPYPADHPVHREALMRIEVVIAGAKADIEYWRSVRSRLISLSSALNTVPIVDCDKSAMDDHGSVPRQHDAATQNAMVRPQPTLDALRSAISNAPNAKQTAAIVLPSDNSDAYGTIDATQRLDDAIIRMRQVQQHLEAQSVKEARPASNQMATRQGKPQIKNGQADKGTVDRNRAALVEKAGVTSTKTGGAQTQPSKMPAKNKNVGTAAAGQNRAGSKMESGKSPVEAQTANGRVTPDFSPLNVVLPKKDAAKPSKTTPNVKKVEVPNTIKKTRPTFTATFPDANPTPPKNTGGQMTAVKAPPLVVLDYLGNPVNGKSKAPPKSSSNGVIQ